MILYLNVSCSGGDTMHVTTDDLIFEQAPPKEEETEEDRHLHAKQSERPKDFGQPYNLSKRSPKYMLSALTLTSALSQLQEAEALNLFFWRRYGKAKS